MQNSTPIVNLYFKELPDYEIKHSLLKEISKINLFIGGNNSGKSRLLRSLFKNYDWIYSPWWTTSPEYLEIESDYIKILNSHLPSQQVSKVLNIDRLEMEDTRYLSLMSVDNRSNINLYKYSDILMNLSTAQVRDSNDRNIPFRRGSLDVIRQQGERIHTRLSELIQPFPTYYFVYVPLLRGLRTISENEDMYWQKTKEEYFVDVSLNDNQEIFTGQKLFAEIRSHLLGERMQREMISEYEHYLSKEFFEGKPFSLIPKEGKNSLHVRIGEEERPVHELGDGIQNIIILTFPIFKHRDKNLIMFVEEPENNLHAGMQRKWIEKVQNENNLVIFAASHSNHFLDMTLDWDNISVYTVKKEDTKKIVNLVSSPNLEPLELLGVRNSSVFLSNATIWVEGITDRLYLRRYLDLYQKSLGESSQTFAEDIHFSFVEYGGANVTHWGFDPTELEEETIDATKVSNKIMLIADRDDSKTKLARHEKLRRQLGDDHYIQTPGREVENLISPEVLTRVINEYEDCEAVYDWLKIGSYKDVLLGTFIDSNISNSKRKYAGKSGTINDKVNFCKKVISHTRKYEDLTIATQNLIEKIYNFIKENNT